MPLHDFSCPSCSHEWEAFTGVISDPSALACPLCGGVPLRRVGFAGRCEIYDSKNLEPGEIRMALRHRRDIERGVSEGRMSYKPGKMSEFEPRVERQLF